MIQYFSSWLVGWLVGWLARATCNTGAEGAHGTGKRFRNQNDDSGVYLRGPAGHSLWLMRTSELSLGISIPIKSSRKGPEVGTELRVCKGQQVSPGCRWGER